MWTFSDFVLGTLLCLVVVAIGLFALAGDAIYRMWRRQFPAPFEATVPTDPP